MSMSPPRNSRLAACVALLSFIGAATFIGLPLFQQVILPLAREGQSSSALSPAHSAALVLLSLTTVLLLGFTLFRQVNTQITEQGVVVPGFATARTYLWSDVTRVSSRGVRVRLHTAATTASINVLCYAPPSAVLPYLMEKLPEHSAVNRSAA